MVSDEFWTLSFAAFIVRDTVPVREQKIKRKKSKKLKITLAFF